MMHPPYLNIFSRTAFGYCVALLLTSCGEQKVSFNDEIKPLINKHCISCHGGVKRNAGFSLLFREDALDSTESGKPAIIPGDPDNSEVVRRLLSHDPEERMPYKEDPLTGEQIELIRKWISQGAEWGTHWAYVKPQQPKNGGESSSKAGLFSGDDGERSPIDRMVAEKWEEHDLEAAPIADRATLIRRVSIDLTGLPPAPDAVEKFLADERPDAWQRVVDTLLASPAYGERWAAWWLDMARYADTKGYEKDGSRTIWRYRDWVIRAFNSDMPFDQFTVEQLAGDLLPNPTDDQYIATAFHRNTMTNDEGGTDDEEFRVASLIDRVNTTFQVWQSTTIGCVQCHSHPYDPFRHEEYYKAMAFFNNTRDEDTEGDFPKLRDYAPADRQEVEQVVSWAKQFGDQTAHDARLFLRTLEPKLHPHRCDRFVNGSLMDNKWIGIRHGGRCRIPAVDLSGKDILVFNYWTSQTGGAFQIRVDDPNGPVLAQSTLPKTDGVKAVAIPINRLALGTKEGTRDLYWSFTNRTIPADKSVCGVEWFAFQPGTMYRDKDISDRFMRLINLQPSSTPVMVESTGEYVRATHVFERGNRLVHGQKVSPQVPAALNDFPSGAQVNRLGFAKWLMSLENPLTARTMVNRLWEQMFGQGLVTTLEDFGTQGDAPSHPELLDHLAIRFSADYHWSVKKILREMVLSETYRRESRRTDDRDPSNRWLARGPRVRLSAEQVRDQALNVSGLLSDKMFGPSVMPWQPDNVWQTVYSGEVWQTSAGADQHRRGVYTFMKRTSPYPSVMMFDGSSREVCMVQRVRTNTPLQALVTLNDPVYVEAAGALAASVKGSTTLKKISGIYERCMMRPPSVQKLEVLADLYASAWKEYSTNPISAERYTGCRSTDPKQAALTVVAHAVLNLDEFLMKE